MALGRILKLLMGGWKQTSPDNAVPQLEESAEILAEPPATEFEIKSDEVSVPVTATTPAIELTTVKSPQPDLTTIELPISEGKNMINISMLQQELQSFVTGASDVQGAALVSPDGLALASVLPGGMDEERTAAMSASMLSLGERIGRELSRGNVERIVVEGEKGYGVLVGCGSDAVLLVLASAAVKQGILFLELKRVVAKLAPLLG
ncbi:roadblock/LC7 family protein [Calothrix sp. NIES-4071]|nr:roadblock/LC7 family protein [Calothrix sp. NIES-4071]BAZ62118.1 roadblock/LC7 family protein [Calothrix sp. NIES-4105]